MRKDHRPLRLKRLLAAFERAWTRHFIEPQLDAVGAPGMIMKPWHFRLHGRGIRLGERVHVVAASDRPVRLTTWQFEQHQGQINIGDYALLCPGVRIDSASRVDIGNNCMLAANTYVTDADWHDVYDRTRPVGETAPVVLHDNVWLGDSVIVCKGVQIGENTVVGAGAVVARDLPANVIAAGNPAQVLREIDPTQALVRREDLLGDHSPMPQRFEALERLVFGPNRWRDWLRSVFAPSRED